MSDKALVIDVGGDHRYGSSRLGAWLERVPGVWADEVSPPANGPFFRLTTRRFIVRVTSTAAEQGLSQALAGWLATRKSTVTLRISHVDGEVVELQGGTAAEEVARRIETTLASLGLEPQAADPGPEAIVPPDDSRQAREQLVELRKFESLQYAIDTEAIDVEQLEALWAKAAERVDVLAIEERIRPLLDADPELAARFAEIFGRAEERQGDPVSDGPGDVSAVPTLPVTIYLSDEGIHGQVEAAVGELLDVAGLRIESRGEPVIGSWFRWIHAAAKEAIHSPAAREGALVAAHAADTRLVLAQDAAVTATLLQNLGPVIASLQPTKDAVLRVGALLIVKVDWAVNVFQLTAAQQAKLDHQPRLAVSPREIIAALDLAPAAQTDDSPLSLE